MAAGTAKLQMNTLDVTAEANPPSGSSFVGFDSLDGHLKRKDEFGVITDLESGGGGLVSDTRANILSLITGDTLVPGTWYLINDAGDGDGTNDVGVMQIATTTNTLSFGGYYIALNADFQISGDYSGVTGFGTQLGVWHSGLTPITGDVVIWRNSTETNLFHYKNLTGSVGSSPDGDPTNWGTPIAKSITTGYIKEVDVCNYSIDTNVVHLRVDNRGNVVYNDLA